MTEIPLPPLPAIGSAHVEIFGPGAETAVWDVATWDEDVWATAEWNDVTPQTMVFEVIWGADDPAGALTIAAAGSWMVRTYDPNRILDPSNGNSQFAASLRPGRPMRITHHNPETGEVRVVRTGLIDEINYDIDEMTGELRGTDGISLMAVGKLPPDQQLDINMPYTLRARARYLLQKAGLDLLINVEPTEEGMYDPPVGPPVEAEASVWSHILNAAYDALFAVWMDRHAMLRFRSFGVPVDNGFAAGGIDGIQMHNVQVAASLSNVYTRVVAYDVLQPESPVTAFDAAKAAIYGDIPLRRQPPVPNAQTWADNVLADRSGAALQYKPGTMYPQTVQHLYDILDLGMIDIMHVRATEYELDIPTRVLGGKIVADTGTGWTAEIVSYIPAKEWEGDESLPPPIEPPPVSTVQVTRLYNCTKSTVVARTPGGQQFGAGKGPVIPIGSDDDWRYRGFFDFAEIDFEDVYEIVKGELLVNNSDQQMVTRGSAPKITLKRITEEWSEGGATTPNDANATRYPGPSVTSTGAVTHGTGTDNGHAMNFPCTNIVRGWHSGSKQYGIGVFSAGEDNPKYTTEWWAHEDSNEARRPQLRLTLKVRA